MSEDYVLKSKIAEFFQTIIQTGILFTLLAVAYGVGQLINKIEFKLEDHEKRISTLEQK